MQILVGKMKGAGRKQIAAAVAFNMETAQSRGEGNRARRRAGEPVVDSTAVYPYSMSAGELAAFMRADRYRFNNQ